MLTPPTIERILASQSIVGESRSASAFPMLACLSIPLHSHCVHPLDPGDLVRTLLLVAISVLVLNQIGFFPTAAVAQSVPSNSTTVAQSAPPPARAADYGKLPLSFEANLGQSDPRVRFLSRGQGYSLFLTDSAAILALTQAARPTKALAAREAAPVAKADVVRMELLGVSPALQIAGKEQLPGIANCFIGSDPAKWRSNIPTFAKVKYANVYSGIDLIYYGNLRQLEYDFVLAPGADVTQVRLRFAGANKLALDRAGSLTVSASNGAIAFQKPLVYQEKNGQRQAIVGQFSLMADNTVGFTLGKYDHSRPLVIDPVLAYSTYLGGRTGVSGYSYSVANAIAVDEAGNAYVTGTTAASDFPVTPNAFQKVNGIPGPNGSAIPTTAFVTKMNAAGSALVYSTYLGGSGINPGGFGGEQGYGIAVDSSGSAYITGITFSTNFPVTSGAIQKVNTNSYLGTAFATKLNPGGSALVYSTYLGGTHYNGLCGNNADGGSAIAVDSAHNAYVAGFTSSYDFATTPDAYQTVNKNRSGEEGYYDCDTGFVTKLNSAGSALVYSTYLGGSHGDDISGIALDTAGNAYVTGKTYSSDFPVSQGAFQTQNKGAGSASINWFVSKLNADGSDLDYSTYLGGSGEIDFSIVDGPKMAVDASGHAYVAGETTDATFPVTGGAFQPTNSTDRITGFVTKFDPTGTALVYSTFLGGSHYAWINGIAVDSAGRAFVAGLTLDSDFPVTVDAFQKTNRAFAENSMNAFFTELNTEGSALVYSTYFGGSASDSATDVALDGLGNAYLAGQASSTNFPVTRSAFQTQNKAGAAFITKFVFTGATTTHLAAFGDPRRSGARLWLIAHVEPGESHSQAWDEQSAQAQLDSPDAWRHREDDRGTKRSGLPRGTVAFIIDGQTVANAELDRAGYAEFTTGSLAAGTHTVTASYLGDPKAYSASSRSLMLTIGIP